MRKISCLVLPAMLLCVLVTNRAQAEDMDQKYIRQAIQLSLEAVEKGDEPFGAVLVRDGKVIAQAPNTIKTDDNVTHHAELNTLAAAYRKVGPKAFAGSTLYASSEPCVMCCGGIYESGVACLVYGLSGAKLAKMSHFKREYPSRGIFRVVGDKIKVKGPVLEQEAAKAVEKYLAMRKQKAKEK